ncbi:hypothetical protein Taro_035804 [Colocasia esculenta]|uniref:Uncharacterized protein n=1 Tax=Colocasia esculenta TaxID=4460 RepID=A0A843W6Q0_COLES|nr:hypothetical protein [Colocasia esculenta]
MDDAYVRSAMDCLHLQPDLSKVRAGGHIYRSPNLKMNSWVQLPLYDADFGWGWLVFIGPTRTLCEGMAHVFPRPATVDGLTLVIALQTTAKERFKAIFYDF